MAPRVSAACRVLGSGAGWVADRRGFSIRPGWRPVRLARALVRISGARIRRSLGHLRHPLI